MKFYILLAIIILFGACSISSPNKETIPDNQNQVSVIKEVVVVSQPVFGNLKLIWPLEHPVITSKFGYRDDLEKGPTGGGDSIHFGLDIIPENRKLIHAPILASADGIVVVVYPPPSKKYRGHSVFGGCIQIKHDTGMKSNSGKEIYLYTFYAHLSDTWVMEGQAVKQGERIGTMGETGQAEGYHLHYEVAFDPMDFMEDLK